MPGRSRGSGAPTFRRITGAATVSVAGSLPVFLMGTLAVQLQRDLDLDEFRLGVLIAGFYAGAAVGSIPMARLVVFVGIARAMLVGSVLVGGLLAAMATVGRNFGVMATLIVLCGGIASALSVSSNEFISRRVVRGRQGLAFGVKQASEPLAVLLGGLAVSVIALQAGWRFTLLIAAALAFVAGVPVLRERPEWIARAKRRGPGKLDRLPLGFLAIGLFCGLAGSSGLAAFFVVGAVAVGLSVAQAGFAAAIASGVAVCVRVGLGYLADRTNRDQLRMAVGMLLIGACGYALLVAAMVMHSSVYFVLGALVALGGGWGWNGLLNLSVTRAYSHMPARATSMTQVGARLGAMAGPLLMGAMIGSGSYWVAWSLGAGAMLVAAAAVGFGRRLMILRSLVVALPAAGRSVRTRPPKQRKGTSSCQGRRSGSVP